MLEFSVLSLLVNKFLVTSGLLMLINILTCLDRHSQDLIDNRFIAILLL
jgi:hypothetical protein